MNKVDAHKRFEAGACMVVCEYRSSRVDHIAWRDKTTGKAMQADLLRHTVEVGNTTVSVAQRLAEDVDPNRFVANFPLKKGDKCVMHFTQWHVERGATSANGELEKLEIA